jgi:acetyl esterase/lipase
VKTNGKVPRLALAAATAVIVLVCAAGIVLIRRYQALVEDEPEVTLSPTIADVTYCTVDGTALTLDLYLPSSAFSAPHPLLVYIHGGSFTAGDKRKGSGVVDIPAMTERGYAVAAVNYRLMPKAPYPSALQDCRCAIRFLRARADEYQLAVDKIGVWGGSAGGYYAALTGLTAHDKAFDAGEYLDEPSTVDAVVTMFGPADLTAEMGWLQRWLLRRAFGTDDRDDPLLRQASPVNFSAQGAPPFLILHGDRDSAVPVEHAQALYQHLLDAKVDATLVIVKNANHNFKPTGGAISPTRAEISEQMADFFDRHLLSNP